MISNTASCDLDIDYNEVRFYVARTNCNQGVLYWQVSSDFASELHVQVYSRHKTLIWYDPSNKNANNLPQPHKSSPTPSQKIISHILTNHFPYSFRSSPIPSHIIFHFLTNHLPQPHKSYPTPSQIISHILTNHFPYPHISSSTSSQIISHNPQRTKPQRVSTNKSAFELCLDAQNHF